MHMEGRDCRQTTRVVVFSRVGGRANAAATMPDLPKRYAPKNETVVFSRAGQDLVWTGFAPRGDRLL